MAEMQKLYTREKPRPWETTAGVFSMTVFAALIGAVFFVSLAGLGAKLWFHRTM